MNSCREFEGKNIEAAIALACKQLNIKKENIKYDIISSGSSGIFSIIGRKKAKISVIIETAKTTDSISSLVDEAFGVTKKSRPNKNFKKNGNKPQQQTQQKNNQNNTPKPENRKQNNKSNNIKPANSNSRPKPENKSSENVEKYEQREKIISDFYKGKSSEEIGIEVIKKILKYITDDIHIDTETKDDTITYKLTGGESAIIIGKRGQTLEAIQYLVDKIVNKHTLERKRVQIDVEGYLEKRKENLEKMAIRMSEKVIKTGKPSTISQMSSQDRRIIHLTLKENKEIRTQSMGEGYYRRLVIFPKKGRKRRPKKN